jgi:uracil-DNA glycosylase
MTAEVNRLAYLQAMEIDVWRERAAQEVSDSEQVPDNTPNSAADIPRLSWEQLQQQVAACKSCGLHETRTQTVFGTGNPNADWLIIGEAPGQQEDLRGEPFVGRAGQLLDQMLIAVGLDRQAVFIANVLKCRPPNNRDPATAEAAACRHYLERQIELINPRIVLAVGRIAAQLLLASDAPLGRLRGREHFLKNGTLPLVVTYHPAYLLRSPSQKAKAWQDLCLAMSIANEQDQ